MTCAPWRRHCRSTASFWKPIALILHPFLIAGGGTSRPTLPNYTPISARNGGSARRRAPLTSLRISSVSFTPWTDERGDAHHAAWLRLLSGRAARRRRLGRMRPERTAQPALARRAHG